MTTTEEKVDSIIWSEMIFENLDVTEAAYPGNIGFQEMVKFYQKASSIQIKKMEKIVKDGDFEEFKNLIRKVLGVKLKQKGKENEPGNFE